ncbi:hypothetical protein Tcan_05265 [Toxocara canis]|uniref:Uncharacterized protein n=1 Tax=Toxocara canis TaxID=6265 RepID=A0A0B2VHS1_TOXCA|nr:hypothetical protein Tcan_05265 [Toxocara canis]
MTNSKRRCDRRYHHHQGATPLSQAMIPTTSFRLRYHRRHYQHNVLSCAATGGIDDADFQQMTLCQATLPTQGPQRRYRYQVLNDAKTGTLLTPTSKRRHDRRR